MRGLTRLIAGSAVSLVMAGCLSLATYVILWPKTSPKTTPKTPPNGTFEPPGGPPEGHISRSYLDRIRFGMTPEEVAAVIGRPGTPADPEDVPEPYKGTHLFATMWEGEDWSITIHFDQNSRVSAIGYSYRK